MQLASGKETPVEIEFTSSHGSLSASDGLLSHGCLAEEEALDVGEDAAAGDGGGGDELVELLVVAHGEHEVPRLDRLLLVLVARVACELQNLLRDVLEHGRHVDAATFAGHHGVAALLQLAAHAASWEDKVAAGRHGDSFLSNLAGSSASLCAWHFVSDFWLVEI